MIGSVWSPFSSTSSFGCAIRPMAGRVYRPQRPRHGFTLSLVHALLCLYTPHLRKVQGILRCLREARALTSPAALLCSRACSIACSIRTFAPPPPHLFYFQIRTFLCHCCVLRLCRQCIHLAIGVASPPPPHACRHPPGSTRFGHFHFVHVSDVACMRRHASTSTFSRSTKTRPSTRRSTPTASGTASPASITPTSTPGCGAKARHMPTGRSVRAATAVGTAVTPPATPTAGWSRHRAASRTRSS